MTPRGNVIDNHVKGVCILGVSIDNKEVAFFKSVEYALGSFNELKRGLEPFLVGLDETHGQCDGVQNVEAGVIYVVNLYCVFS